MYSVQNETKNQTTAFTNLSKAKAYAMEMVPSGDKINVRNHENPFLESGMNKICTINKGVVIWSTLAFSKRSYKPKQIKLTIENICRDVIANIQSKKLHAAMGNLYRIDDTRFIRNRAEVKDLDSSAKTLLNNLVKTSNCKVCAKGGILFSYVMRHNNCTIHSLNEMGYDTIEKNWPQTLLEVFPKKLLDKIEVAFEGTVFGWTDSEVKYRDKTDLYQLYYKYPNPDDRLIAIMEAVIAGDIK